MSEEVRPDGDARLTGDGTDRSSPGRSRGRVPGGARWWRLGATSAALAALVWGASAWTGGLQLGEDLPSDDATVTSAGAVALVEAAALACPGPELVGVPGSEETTQQVDVVAALAPAGIGGRGDSGDGSAELGTTGDGRGAEELERSPADLAVDGDEGVLVRAAGHAAPGVVAGQLSVSRDPGGRGVSLTPCVAAAETQWLVGGGAAPGRTEQLVLTNPGDDAVTVEVDVWGAGGPAPTTGTNAVVVPARGRSVQLLDAVAASVESPVVRVRSTGGPVAAHLGEHQREGTTDLGAEVVAPATAPTTDLVVPAVLPGGLPGGAAAAVTLRVVAPAEAPAVVDLTALTAEGAVRLAGQVTRVAGGHVVDVLLDDLPAGTLALRLRSDTPVTAGALVTLAPSGEEPLPADDAASTSDADDDASVTARPGEQDEPLVRPAGETAWVAGTVPASSPVGVGLPARDGIPGSRALLAVTVVDAAEVAVHWLAADGAVEVVELGRLANDTTVELEVPVEARAVWVTSGGPAGVVASVVLTGADRGGPYLAAATLPVVPWERAVTEVTVLRP